MNTGTATGTHLRLGQNPDGLRYFQEATTHDYHRMASPVFAPSRLPLVSNNLGSAPIIRTYQAGGSANVSLSASTQTVRLTSLPA
eukprot:6802708-Prymnesium_polylepis.1